MRVITGTARGRKLITLEGLDTRPTTDRVKESIFNIIQFDVPGRKILDLFGGSGQMAIEALSRGADSAVIVDANTAATKIIAENVKNCGFEKAVKIVCGDFANFLSTTKEKFDVIFLDPPYRENFLTRAINTICDIDILTDGGIIVCESMRETMLPVTNAPYIKGREYLYGKSKITVYRKEQ